MRILRAVAIRFSIGMGRSAAPQLRAVVSLDQSGDLFRPLPGDDCFSDRLRGTRLECGDVWWTGPPTTRLPARDDVNVEVRHLLQTGHAVILVNRDAIWIERSCQGAGGAPHLVHDFYGFSIGQIQDRRRMPARNDEKLADFELSWVDERERSVGRIDDVPGFAMSGGQLAIPTNLTNLTAVAYRGLSALSMRRSGRRHLRVHVSWVAPVALKLRRFARVILEHSSSGRLKPASLRIRQAGVGRENDRGSN